MEKGKVSIIVPCYKQAEYLAETLDSVLAQTYRNWECVIINDGSPDNTEEVANKYITKDKRFRYIWQKNKGVSAARNYGISNSNGEFILPLDADDLIASTYIEKAIDYFFRFPKTKLVYCKADRFGKEKGYWDLEQFDYEKFIWDNCIFCTAMFRRTDYDQTIGYNENMTHGNEDWDFWLSLLKKGDAVFQINEVLFHYRIKETSRTTDLSAFYWRENHIQLCKNHPDIYDPFKEMVLLYYKESQDLSTFKHELKKIKKSHAYRLGKTLLKPLIWTKKMIGK